MAKNRPVKSLRDQDELRSLVRSYSNLTEVGVKMLAATRSEERVSAADKRADKARERDARLARICP